MKKNFLYLMASAFAGLALAACSDDIKPADVQEFTQTDGVDVNAVTDPAVLNGRVHNYKGGSRASRAQLPGIFADLNAMPDYAAVEAAAAAADQATFADYNTGVGLINQWGGGDVCIVADCSDVQLGAANKNIYVKSNITITNAWGSNYSVYILKGGSVTWAGGNSGNISATQANVKYYNYGTLKSNDDVISLHGGTQLFNADGAVLGCKEIVVNGGRQDWSTGSEVVYPSGLYVEGNLDNINLKAQKGCAVNIESDLFAEGIDLKFDGDVRIGGLLKAQSLEAENNCHLYSECGIILDKDFVINANGSFTEVTYVKAANVWQCAGSNIKMPNGGMLDIAGIYQNLNNGNDASVTLTEVGFAVVKAAELQWNAGDPLTNVYLFKTPCSPSQIVVDCEKYARLDNNLQPVYMDFDEFEFMGATVKRIESDADRNVTIAPGSGCNENGYNPTPDPEDDPVIDVVTDIEHNHDISATCLQYYNGKIYASYHQRGAAQHGCLEVFQTVNDVTTLLQFVEDANNELDFNHLIIDPAQSANGRLYVVGNSSKKGAIMAYMNLAADGLMDTEAKNYETSTALPLNLIKLQAGARGDGNCIVRNGEQYNVMTTGGFETYSAADHSLIASVATPGKAKHIALGNGSIYATYLTKTASDEDEEIPVEMRKFDASSVGLDNPTIDNIAAGTIQPNNGKNVIAVDPVNGNVYACLGRDGLKCMDANGNEIWTYQPAHVTIENPASPNFGAYKAFCNGVAVDDNYIYVAYGSFGLIILDKNGKELAKSKSTKSANYVSLADGYIYVAYGRERIRVFKFYPEGISAYASDYGIDE